MDKNTKPPADWTRRANVTLPAAMADYINDIADHQGMPVYRLVLEAVQAWAVYHGGWPYQDGK